MELQRVLIAREGTHYHTRLECPFIQNKPHDYYYVVSSSHIPKARGDKRELCPSCSNTSNEMPKLGESKEVA